MQNLWSRFGKWTLDHARLVIAIGVVCSLFFGYWAVQVEPDHGSGHFLSSDAPAFQDAERTSQRFGNNQSILYLIFPDVDPAQPAFLDRLRALTDTIQAQPGVQYVLSLTNAPHLTRQGDTLAVGTLLPIDLPPEALQDRIGSQPFLKDLLIAGAGDAVALFIKITPDYNDSPKRLDLVRTIERTARAQMGEVALAGAPYMRTEYAQRVTSEMPMLAIFSLLLSVFFLFLAFRSIRAVLMPAVIVVLGFTWTLALMALTGYKLNVVTSILPALIVVIGIANAIHISTKFYSLYARFREKYLALEGTIETVGVATFLTCLTTAIGFAVLVFSGSDQLGVFGIFASVGIMLLYLLSITLIPAVFWLTKPPAPRTLRASNDQRLQTFFVKLSTFNRQHATGIIQVGALIVCIGLLGLFRMPENVQVFTDFDEADPVRQNLMVFERSFGGLLPMDIVIEAKRDGQFRGLGNLRKLDRLQERLKALPQVARVFGLPDLTKFTTQAYFGGDPRNYRLPTQLELPFLRKALKQLSPGGSSGGSFGNVPTFVDTTFTNTRLLAGVRDIGTQRMLTLRDSIQAIALDLFPEERFNIVITGQAVTSSLSNSNLVRNLVISLSIALVIISILMAALFRSLPLTLISLAPNVIPLLMVGGAMGYLGIALRPSTALIFPIAFGIAVDDTIHFLTKYRMLRSGGRSVDDAIQVTLRETGKAILFTSVVLVGGFSVFMFSGFAGTANMGGLTALSLFIALTTNLVLLPALLFKFGERHVEDVAGLSAPEAFEAQPMADIDDDAVPTPEKAE